MSHIAWTYVAFLLTGICYWRIKNMAFVPICYSNHCNNYTIYLYISILQNCFILPLAISLYYSAFTIVSYVTLFMTRWKFTILFLVFLNNYIFHKSVNAGWRFFFYFIIRSDCTDVVCYVCSIHTSVLVLPWIFLYLPVYFGFTIVSNFLLFYFSSTLALGAQVFFILPLFYTLELVVLVILG